MSSENGTRMVGGIGDRLGHLLQVVRFRGRQWSKILLAYFSAQSAAQLLSIGAGILLIRAMPKSEFALYSFAFSVIAFFHFLTDLGSTSSLLHFRRTSLVNGEEFGDYVAAVLSLRRSIFALGALAVMVSFPLMAAAEGFPALDAGLAAVAITATVWFQLLSSIRLLVLRLEDRYGQSYRAELLGGALRLVLAGLMVLSALLDAWIGVFTAAAGAAVVAWMSRDGDRRGTLTRDLSAHRKRVIRYLLPTLPSALYFSIQGPMVIWLAATFGGTDNIAEVGALGRLGMVVGLFSGLIGVVFVPRLSQITDDRHYLRRHLQFGSFMVVIAAAMTAAAAVVPGAFLFILGPTYAGLHRELLLTVGGAGFTLLGGYIVAVNFARSWNRWQGVAAGLQLLGQIVLVALIPLGTTAGVLSFRLLTAAIGLGLQLLINLVGFIAPRWVAWS